MSPLMDICVSNEIPNTIGVASWLQNVFQSSVSDSQNLHTDKYYLHSYIPLYDDLFRDYKDQPLKLLEIGIQKGGSLFLWKTFFTQGTIYGFDIAAAPTWLEQTDGVTCYQGDAYTEEGVGIFEDASLDIIIDDGPHTLDSMCFVAEYYMPKVVVGGILVIEDIPDLEWIDSIRTRIPSNIHYDDTVYDLRSEKGRFDDIMLVLKRVENTVSADAS